MNATRIHTQSHSHIYIIEIIKMPSPKCISNLKLIPTFKGAKQINIMRTNIPNQCMRLCFCRLPPFFHRNLPTNTDLCIINFAIACSFHSIDFCVDLILYDKFDGIRWAMKNHTRANIIYVLNRLIRVYRTKIDNNTIYFVCVYIYVCVMCLNVCLSHPSFILFFNIWNG